MLSEKNAGDLAYQIIKEWNLSKDDLNKYDDEDEQYEYISGLVDKYLDDYVKITENAFDIVYNFGRDGGWQDYTMLHGKRINNIEEVAAGILYEQLYENNDIVGEVIDLLENGMY